MTRPQTLLQDGWRESVRVVNGVTPHVVQVGDEGAPLLVLLHGFPEFWWAWRPDDAITHVFSSGF